VCGSGTERRKRKTGAPRLRGFRSSGDQLLDFVIFRKASGLVLRVDELAVEKDVELPFSARLDGDFVARLFGDERRDTRGVGTVVSHLAVFDQDLHEAPPLTPAIIIDPAPFAARAIFLRRGRRLLVSGRRCGLMTRAST